VESSSKCGSIETYLGSSYKCISCNGHIRVINDLKNIDVKGDFETTYSVDPDKKAHISKMESIISAFPKENILLATDHDREGEAIAWHICEVFDLPVLTTRRILFHEVTKPALLKAVENPGIIDMDMVRAQQARQVLDLLVGFTISPLLWKYVFKNNQNALSAGRCQTPALRLVYENDLEAKTKAENSRQKHRIQACFFPQNLMFELQKEFETETEVCEFLSLSASHPHKFMVHPQKLSERTPPKPFNTSALLQQANNLLHIGAKETMACCQTLYQLGHITYMRTENRKYSPIFIDTATKYICGKWTDKHVHPTLMELNGNADTENPHEAIRVTNLNMQNLVLIGDKNTGSIERVYRMIWQNTVQSCMAPATFNMIPLEIDAPKDNLYKYTFEIPKFGGFLDSVEKSNVEKSNVEKSNVEKSNVEKSNVEKSTTADKSVELISSMSLRFQMLKNKTVNYNYIQSVVGFTNRHSRYSEAGLISKLEDLGIGRPSTFSMLIDVIQTRKYVEKTDVQGIAVECHEYFLRADEKAPTAKSVKKTMGAEHGKLVIDPMGIVVIEFLMKHFSNLFSYDYTKQMEERLDQVALGKERWNNVCKDVYGEIHRLVKEVNKIEKKVYNIDENYSLIFFKDGFLLKHKSLTNEDGKPLLKSVKKGVKIDIVKLELGGYTYEDLAETERRILGIWNEYEIELKPGKFGAYVEYGDDKKVSLNKLKKTLDKIVLEDVIPFLEEEKPATTVLRVLTPTLSIRNGKFGPYIFYKTEKMKKPKFYDLKGFEQGFGNCDAEELIEWIKRTHIKK
jgi:DNA topoisomerase-1